MKRKQETLNAADFRRMIGGAYAAFLTHHEMINSLNVFPVPDGDTGTNMLLTLGAVQQTVRQGEAGGIGQLSRKAADSAIMGARGNSGVILAQIFRGVARGLAGKETATSTEIGKAFQYGILYAYRAVARPVEGTILTVARGIAKGARRAVRGKRSFGDILREAVAAGKAELARTPELLPVLKDAGVVDAGGQGLIVLLEGCLAGLEGRYQGPEADFERALALPDSVGQVIGSNPYCTEFLVKGSSAAEKEAARLLDALGESLIVASAGDILKVHIHTARPGLVLETALAWGTLHDIKIDNMADQHRETIRQQNGRSGLAVICVSPGEGLSQMMRNLGAAVVIDGGPTMNPPVEEFVNAIHSGQAERYIILPNNANILLAAIQAQKLVGPRAEVLATRNVPQGLAALVAFSGSESLEANLSRMKVAADVVRAAGVTRAVRDSVVDGQPITAGQYLGVTDDRTCAVGDDPATVLQAMVSAMVTSDTQLISLYYGAELDQEQAAKLVEGVGTQFPEVEVQLYFGGQPHYLFLIGAE